MTVAFASFSGFHGNVTLHCHWKYSLLALLQPCSVGVSLQNFALFPTSSTRIAKHRSFIKLKFLQNFCSSCKTLADQVSRNPRFYCTYIIVNEHFWHRFRVQEISNATIPPVTVQMQLLYVACYVIIRAHAVAQLVEALHCKPEGRRFDSRWCQWNYSFI